MLLQVESPVQDEEAVLTPLRIKIENIDMRIAEQRSKLEKELDKTNPYKLKNQSGGQELNPTIDFEKERKQRELENQNRPPDDQDNNRTFNLDR